jgi:hypothetical protein
MKPEVTLEVLQGAAEQLGIRVSYEAIWTASGGLTGGMRGGLCRVKGAGTGAGGMVWRVIVDKRATVEERVTTLASALAGFDTTQLELPVKIRELLKLHEPSAKHRRPAA